MLQYPQHASVFIGAGRNASLGIDLGAPQMSPDDNPDKRARGPVFMAQTMVSLPTAPPDTQSTLVIVLPNVPQRPVSRKYHLPAGTTALVNFYHPRDDRPTIIYREMPNAPKSTSGEVEEIRTLKEKNQALEARLTQLSKEYKAVKTVVEEGWATLASPRMLTNPITNPRSGEPR